MIFLKCPFCQGRNVSRSFGSRKTMLVPTSCSDCGRSKTYNLGTFEGAKEHQSNVIAYIETEMSFDIKHRVTEALRPRK